MAKKSSLSELSRQVKLTCAQVAVETVRPVGGVRMFRLTGNTVNGRAGSAVWTSRVAVYSPAGTAAGFRARFTTSTLDRGTSPALAASPSHGVGLSRTAKPLCK
jgi:hypothetical protein